VTLWVQTPNLREQYIGIAKLVTFAPIFHFHFEKITMICTNL
jgi:hypothetical protein